MSSSKVQPAPMVPVMAREDCTKEENWGKRLTYEELALPPLLGDEVPFTQIRQTDFDELTVGACVSKTTRAETTLLDVAVTDHRVMISEDLQFDKSTSCCCLQKYSKAAQGNVRFLRWDDIVDFERVNTRKMLDCHCLCISRGGGATLYEVIITVKPRSQSLSERLMSGLTGTCLNLYHRCMGTPQSGLEGTTIRLRMTAEESARLMTALFRGKRGTVENRAFMHAHQGGKDPRPHETLLDVEPHLATMHP